MSDNDEGSDVAAETQERSALRTIRDVLHAETEQLRRAYEATSASMDVVALRTWNQRLIRHNDKLVQFLARLEAFHQRYGPLGK